MKRQVDNSGDATQLILRHWREAVPNDRLAHLVKDAWRSFERSLQIRVTGHNVPFGHWRFLRVLWESNGITQRELSEQAGVMEPSTFAALKSMERRGYITRRKKRGNRKKVYILLTPKGRRLKAKLVPLAIKVNEIAVRGASAAEIAATRKTLLLVIENLAADATNTRRRLLGV